jgi:site-specific DNA-methyltransferase (adenine-specific)
VTPQALSNKSHYLCYGDNLDILRRMVQDETVDLCYIDPPFNSKRNYNQIYNNIGEEDRAQAQAFTDMWRWDDRASEGFEAILSNEAARFTGQLIELIRGLEPVLKRGSLLAYLVSMSLRITEIHRTLKQTGSFFLHCDPNASHYLKLVLDAIFLPQGGEFRNEIIWHYLKWSVQQRQFVRNHDVILFYSKSDDPNRVFNTLFVERSPATQKRFGNAKIISSHDSRGQRLPSQVAGESEGVAMDDVWDISRVPPIKQLYPTEKPPVLMERIIKATTNPGDLVLDAYCGCGTTVAVAETLKRRWIGMDITYQSISTILRRLEKEFPGQKIADSVILDGIPRDIASACALANKKDDRLRKEFEKWAVLTYTQNRAVINEKKGADAGIDGAAYFWRTKTETDKVVFQVKSGHVQRGDIAKLKGDMEREKAAIGILLTLEAPTSTMKQEAKAAGTYSDSFTGRKCDRVQIVSIAEMLDGRHLDLPLTAESLKTPPPVEGAADQGEFKLQPQQATKKSKMAKVALPLGFEQAKPKSPRRRGA